MARTKLAIKNYHFGGPLYRHPELAKRYGLSDIEEALTNGETLDPFFADASDENRQLLGRTAKDKGHYGRPGTFSDNNNEEPEDVEEGEFPGHSVNGVNWDEPDKEKRISDLAGVHVHPTRMETTYLVEGKDYRKPKEGDSDNEFILKGTRPKKKVTDLVDGLLDWGVIEEVLNSGGGRILDSKEKKRAAVKAGIKPVIIDEFLARAPRDRGWQSKSIDDSIIEQLLDWQDAETLARYMANRRPTRTVSDEDLKEVRGCP
jgi:hypothetical protein